MLSGSFSAIIGFSSICSAANAAADWGPKMGKACVRGDIANAVFKRVEYVQSLYPPMPIAGQDAPYYYVIFGSNSYAFKSFEREPASPKSEMESVLASNPSRFTFGERAMVTLQILHPTLQDRRTRLVSRCRIVRESYVGHKAGDMALEQHAHVTIGSQMGYRQAMDIIVEFFRRVP